MANILIVDDDPDIGNMLEEVLSRGGHRPQRAYSGTEALLQIEKCRPDLVLLDLMLPGMDGEVVLEHLTDIPVIVVSARLDVQDKVALLTKGARDYVTKPFSLEELLARIDVQLRTAGQAPRTLAYDNLQFDLATQHFTVDGESVRLTPTEGALMRLLLENPKQVLTKSALLDALAMYDLDGTESSLKVHMSNLRKKLKAAGNRDYIESVWGIGFRLAALS